MFLEVDNLVIGRGPVGVITSIALLEKNFKVLNLDLGSDVELSTKDFVLNSNINYKGISKPPSLIKDGNENLWGGACMGWRFFEENFSPENIMPGLPISLNGFSLASNKLKKILKINNFNFSTSKPKYSARIKKTYALEQIFAKIINDPYMSDLIKELNSNPGYQYRANIFIQKVFDYGTHLECVGEFTENKQPLIIKCKRVFLAAGTISNTKLLIKSDLGLVNKNFLGKFLSDHLSSPIALIDSKNLVEVEKYFGYRRSTKGSKLWPRVKLNLEDKMLNLDSFCYVTEVNADTRKGQRILDFLSRFPIFFLFIRKGVKGSFQLNLFTEISNSSKNEIVFDESENLFKVHFQVERHDLKVIGEISRSYIKQISNAFSIKDWQISMLLEPENLLQKLQTSSHPSGSYRMSASPSNGVINSNSQLHYHPNIYVLGAGAFPRSGATHPTFTAMILALMAVGSIN